MVATSEVSVAMTVDDSRNIDAITEELAKRQIQVPNDHVPQTGAVTVAVREEVVAVARVPVPVPQQHLGRPEREERVDVRLF